MTDDLAEGLHDAIVYARIGERLVNVATNIANTAVALKTVTELDAALAPEMRAALDHLTEAAEATKRALAFVDARHQAKWSRPQ